MLVQGTLWHHCLRHLESEVPEQQFNTWVRPLQAVERGAVASEATNQYDAGYQWAQERAVPVLEGTDPGTLVVTKPTSYDLQVNVDAAEAAGLTIPDEVLEEADEVYLIYNRFESALTQRPVTKRLLPAAPEDGEEEEEESGADFSTSYLEYVPDAEVILKELVPSYVETMIWQALLESAAGEHGARMTAMKNATDNANDLSKELTLAMNKARQAQITSEISEIAAGAEALSAG